MRDKYKPDASEANSLKAHLYSLLLKEVLEAKSEVAHLQNVIAKMENQCRQGIRAADGSKGWDSNAMALRQDVKAFDGWVVSLFEPNITLLQYIWNIDTAGNRSYTLHSAIRALNEKRRTAMKLFISDPKLFKLEIK